jgi:3-hydroxyacyl-CoA dehydrogenase
VPAPRGPIAVVGAGSIGTAFAAVFAMAGRVVRLYDQSAAARAAVPARVRDIVAGLREYGLTDTDPDAVTSRVTVCETLEAAVEGACHVQECAPEDLALKRELFARLDALVPASTALASSSSALTASEFAAGLPGAARCLVVHPGNPPYLLRVVEIVPAAGTAPEVVGATAALLYEVGLAPVLVRREIAGFVFNRLQGAMLREAYCLVRDGVASVEEIDRIVRDGLGLRWAVVGPFETVDLNTRGGIEAHAARLGPAYAKMGAERGQHDPWTPDLVAEVTRQRRERLPLEQWAERVDWRDRGLMTLLAARRRTPG